jgi:hypothetical protein
MVSSQPRPSEDVRSIPVANSTGRVAEQALGLDLDGVPRDHQAELAAVAAQADVGRPIRHEHRRPLRCGIDRLLVAAARFRTTGERILT